MHNSLDPVALAVIQLDSLDVGAPELFLGDRLDHWRLHEDVVISPHPYERWQCKRCR